MIDVNAIIILALICCMISMFCCGIFFGIYLYYKRNINILVDKCEFFDDVTKKAITSNNSISDKMIQMDDRLHNLEIFTNNRR